jgi:hypothetical protein
MKISWNAFTPMLAVSFLLALVVGIGCNHPEPKPGKIQAKLVDLITKSCTTDSPCLIHLKDATDFEWDKMYAFNNAADRRKVEDILGLSNISELKEGTKIVFMNKGKIDLFETEPEDLERPLPDHLIFVEDTDVNDYKAYSPNAVFKVKKLKFGEIVQYKLDLAADFSAP